MVPLDSSELAVFTSLLSGYAPEATIAQAAGLLTCPALQANTIRLEVLVHLAAIHCDGDRQPTTKNYRRWLSDALGSTRLAMLEDPVEDVFVTNIDTPQGNRRVFEGIWEGNAYFAHVALDTLRGDKVPQKCRELLEPCTALLRLSECIADRLSLPRWHIEPSYPKGKVRVPLPEDVRKRARAVTFTADDLAALNISPASLEPFIFRSEDRKALASQTTGHTSLERRPLVQFDDRLVFALPHCASPAVRRFIVSGMRDLGYLPAFQKALARLQARQAERDGLLEFKGEAESLEPPAPGTPLPSLHGWLLRYDTGRYLHVLLLHDRLEDIIEQGLTSYFDDPALRAGLNKYVTATADYCRGLPEFASGTTLIVLGGLGRGFGLTLESLPAQWHFSVIRLPDLLMLGAELDHPVRRFVKCIEQRNWADDKGVAYVNMNGDYNFYCHWRQLRSQIVPRELPVGPGAFVAVATDMVCPVREEIRRLVDRHVTETASGEYSPVARLGRDSYFRSLRKLPIYASFGHLAAGVLGGEVETPRGPTWLIVQPRDGNPALHRLLYELWSGFLSLHEKVVTEVEGWVPQTSPGPLEVRLNFNALVPPDERVPNAPLESIPEPQITIERTRGTAEISFPEQLLGLFRQPSNTGERVVLRSIGRALIQLHGGAPVDAEERFLEHMLDSVLVGESARVLHIFHTHYPIEHLLSRPGQKPRFLAHEDFVFSKLQLWEDCIDPPAANRGVIAGKTECNAFLNRVVEKVWHRIRDQLRLLDRSSVVREALTVHEAALWDRDHWRRTAQAVIALYSSAEDVFSVAQAREAARDQVAIPARLILEMALCECPDSGGRQVSRSQLDSLLAQAALLLEVATDSDAIHSDLSVPRVTLHGNGEYGIDRQFHDAVVRPFVAGHFREDFEEAAAAYSRQYLERDPNARFQPKDSFSIDFLRAFEVEFGLSVSEAVEGWAKLLDAAVEADTVVVESTLRAVEHRLMKEASLSPQSCKAFLRALALFSRPSWEAPPPGFMGRDIHPWRFRRRLSVATKPLLVFSQDENAKVFYGAATLRTGMGYLLASAEAGRFPPDFFGTEPMKRYIGAVSDARGHAFALTVAEKLRAQGWQARAEVQMTELGAPAELGDIDVLAWKAGKQVLLVECKRLRLALTVAEIAEICSRFRGEAKDELDRHLRRAEWIRNTPGCLSRIVGFLPTARQLRTRLVTDTHVPMMYLKSLPLRSQDIGPL